jgi:hypothetical protein
MTSEENQAARSAMESQNRTPVSRNYKDRPEFRRMREYVGDFDPGSDPVNRKIRERFPRISFKDLLSMAKLICQTDGLMMTRDIVRNLRCLEKWFSLNSDQVLRFLENWESQLDRRPAGIDELIRNIDHPRVHIPARRR